MQVILLERVDKLGQMGEVVKVKDGFGRNFLIPQGKALRASKRNLESFEQRRAQLEAQNLERRRDAEQAAETLTGRSIVVLRQASESAQLYGSVSARDIAEGFAETGVTFEHRQIRIDAPLKTLGLHEVRVALHPEVDITVTVNVARTADEAEAQAGRVQEVELDEADLTAAAEAEEAAQVAEMFDDEDRLADLRG